MNYTLAAPKSLLSTRHNMPIAMVIASWSAAMLSGCSYSNARNDIGGGYAGLEPGVVLPGLDVERMTTRAADRASSAIPGTLDMGRTKWPRTIFVVPVSGTASGQIYATNDPLATAAARERREFPTPTSALELAPEGYWTIAEETWLAAPYAVYDLLLMPYRAYKMSDDDYRQIEMRGTRYPYARAPVWNARGVPANARPTDELPPRQASYANVSATPVVQVTPTPTFNPTSTPSTPITRAIPSNPSTIPATDSAVDPSKVSPTP